ncbi:hypothetical protein CROQUDRAFT_650815 [Cronartium quercuum f. sp. fusiforme G11]|uniref:Replication protein A subunit n=1 Tax=Cronartium quercuum f. sp. fusiforme G11 TaxID=708437 RepID=A0A9P6NX31_9BASI|nr:hypothetical protein CROQUDRAFT_650815 [Cronartium quercuum f. sp. fusiforme G11]
MSHQLTQGAVHLLYNEQKNDIPNLTLQVLSLKPVGVPAARAANAGPERWRMMISDGTHFITAMLSTQLNHMILENGIQKFSIIRLTNYTINMVGDRRVVVLLGVELLESVCTAKIGNPIACDSLESRAGPVKTEPGTVDTKPTVTAFQPPSTTSNIKPTISNSARAGGPSVIPIAGLSPYSNKWKIKARVAQKSDIRFFNTSRGEGKLFSVTLSDESGQIKATGFSDTVDQLYERLVVGEVFYISRAKVQLAKKQYNTLPHDYEIVFETMTEVDECADAGDVPVIQLSKYMSLGALAEVEKDHICDIVTILKDVGDLGEYTARQTGRTGYKRELTLLDQSGFSVRMTLWGKQAEDFNVPVESIIAFQGVKVGDFQGRTLSMGSSAIMAVNPEISEAFDLRGWYDTEGSTATIQTYNGLSGGTNNAPITEESLKTIGEVRTEGLGQSEKADYFNMRATVMFIKHEGFSYPACQSLNCNKKMVQYGDDEWKCEKCDKTYPAPDHRYLIQVSVSDHTGILWLSGFNDIGQFLLNMPANDLVQLQQEDDAGFRKVLANAGCQTYDFVCRAKQEVYQDTPRTKYQVVRASQVNWVTAGLQLAESLMKNYGHAQ